jgi:hypothetical protein
MAKAEVKQEQITVVVKSTVILTMTEDEALVLRGFLGSFDIGDDNICKIWNALNDTTIRKNTSSLKAKDFVNLDSMTIIPETSSKILG